MSQARPVGETPGSTPPRAGRLCIRAVPDGEALVGVLAFDPDFVPEEGKAYLLVERAGGYAVARQPLDEGIPAPYDDCLGVGDLMISPIWPKTTTPAARVVRFLEAFPDQNRWTVYGVSNHGRPNAPAHAWMDIGAGGVATPIQAPFEACGEAIGQVLSSHAVWPDDSGTLYSLPQLPLAWRGQYLRYHTLLAEAAGDEEKLARLPKLVAQDPYLRALSIGQVDPHFCRYLGCLQERGLLTLDAPRSADEHDGRRQAVQEAFQDSAEGIPSRRAMRR